MSKTVEMVKSQYDEDEPHKPKKALYRKKANAFGVLVKWERRDDLWDIKKFIPLIKAKAADAKRDREYKRRQLAKQSQQPPSNG